MVTINKPKSKAKVIIPKEAKDDKIKKPSREVKEKSSVSPTDLITMEELKEKMQNYKRVNDADVKNLKPDTKIRYIEVFEDGFKYKPGGYLIVNKYPEYLILTSGNRNWSVQLKDHIIFIEISVDELKKEYDHIIATKNDEIKRLKKTIKDAGL